MHYSLLNITRNNVIADKITVADKFWARMRGLMGKKDLKQGEGLLLAPCNAVHMMFMRFPIDVIFMDRDFIVVKILESFKPWRVSPVVRVAFQVVELMAGTASDKGIKTGDKLSIIKAGPLSHIENND